MKRTTIIKTVAELKKNNDQIMNQLKNLWEEIAILYSRSNRINQESIYNLLMQIIILRNFDKDDGRNILAQARFLLWKTSISTIVADSYDRWWVFYHYSYTFARD